VFIRIEEFSESHTEGMDACRAIRRDVFCIEQKVPETLEWDGLDATCRHFLLRVDGVAAATARSRPYGQNAYKIERVAVLKVHRGSGLGRALMEQVLAHARGTGAATAVLNAQTTVRDFYAGLGFVAEGPKFMEADIPHVHMTLRLR
jgi:predicted GNAT family N-acyltransferase